MLYEFDNEIVNSLKKYKKTLEELYSDPLNVVYTNACMARWEEKTLAFGYVDPTTDKTYWMCIDCFFAMKKKGINYIVKYVGDEKCSCGAISHLDNELPNDRLYGKRHQIPNFFNQNPSLHDSLLFYFKQIFNIINKKCDENNPYDIAYILNFVYEFVGTDIWLHCVIESLETLDLKKLMLLIIKNGIGIADPFTKLFQVFFDNEYFQKNFAANFINCYIQFLPMIIEIVEKCQYNFQLHFHKKYYMWMTPLASFWINKNVASEVVKSPHFVEDFITVVNAIEHVSHFKYEKEFLNIGNILNFYSYVLEEFPDKIKLCIVESSKRLTNIEGNSTLQRTFGEKNENENENIKINHKISSFFGKLSFIMLQNNIFVPEIFDIYAEWLNKSKHKLDFDSVLEEGTNISLVINLHLLLSSQLLISKDPQKWLDYIISKVDMFHDNVLSLISSLPVKLMATIIFAKINLFVRNSSIELKYLKRIYYENSVNYILIPLFRLIQYCAEFSHNKESFLKKIRKIFGLYSKEDFEETNSAYLLFIFTLAYDRSCFDADVEKNVKNTIIFNLRKDNLIDPENILDSIPCSCSATKGKQMVEKLLKENSTTICLENKIRYKLKDNSKWVFLLPWALHSDIYCVLEQFTLKNKNSLLPIPYPDSHEGLTNILATKDTFLRVKNRLNCGRKCFELLAYNYIIEIPRLYESEAETYINDIKPLIADSPLKDEIFKRLGVTNDIETDTAINSKRIRREKMLAAKKVALVNLQKNAQVFESKNPCKTEERVTNKKEEIKCCICDISNEKGPLYYQLCYDYVPYACLIQYKISLVTSLYIDICQHLVHKDCFVQKCPLDRLERNMLLPIFDTELTGSPLNVSSIPGLQEFADIFANEKRLFSYNTQVIKSIASILIIFEARIRINPSIVNSPAYKYLFKAIFRIFHLNIKYDTDDEEAAKLTGIECVIFNILNLIDPKEYFDRIVDKCMPKENNFQYLRMCRILKNYLFEKRDLKNGELDDVKSYNTPIDNPKLEPFCFLQAPENLCDIYQGSVNHEYLCFDEDTYYCLLDGRIYNKDFSFCFLCHESGIPLIKITGSNIGKIYIFREKDSGYVQKIPSIYTNWHNERYSSKNNKDYFTLNKEYLAELYESLYSLSYMSGSSALT